MSRRTRSHGRKQVLAAFLALGLALAAGAGTAAANGLALRFSTTKPGPTLPPGWHAYSMSRHKPPARIRLVRRGTGTVLSIDADRSAGAIAYRTSLPAQTRLRWRWEVDHSVAAADMRRKSGDDFAARVYVFFDVPARQLSWYQRLKLRIARHVLGHPLPRAALCYVWDNDHPVGTIAPSPFFSGVHTIVLQSGNARAGTWQVEDRDLAADFRAAFGRPAPRITGIALAADTDNTRSHAHAWFGDLTLTPESAPAAH